MGWPERSALQQTARSALEKFAAVQMIDVHLLTTDGRELLLTRYTQPDPELRLLIQQLKLQLSPQPPPRIATVSVPRHLGPDPGIRDQHLQDLIPLRAPRLRRGKLLRLGGSRSAQKRSSSNSRHNCPASQQAPHWRGRHSRMSDRRSWTTGVSGARPSQRSSGNSASVRGCPASSSTTSTALRHTAACEELIFPKYRT
jgi:hypothetical protein